jgi:3-dehydroquinate synthase
MDRRGVLLCLGGGVIGDLGGFCAATYLRGIDFIQVPTTLLAMTDSAVGGKVGIDLSFVKNIIGAFRDPAVVFLFPSVLRTHPREEVRSGFAELIKHALIADPALWRDLLDIHRLEEADWQRLLPPSITVKQNVVTTDPQETGRRKILNFGHTIGHAAETMALQAAHAGEPQRNPLRHGEAIAIGMICESWLSWKCNGLSYQDLVDITAFLQRFFSHQPLPEEQFPDMLAIMRKDKKNLSGKIRFSLLRDIGDAGFDHTCSDEHILESIRFYHSVFHPTLSAQRKRTSTGQVPPLTSFLPR